MGVWCAFLHEGKIYPGIIGVITMDTTKETMTVKCMQIAGENRFKWHQNEDITQYDLQEIIYAIPEPM